MHASNEQESLGKLIGHTHRSYARIINHSLKRSGIKITFEHTILIHWLSHNPGVPQNHLGGCMDRDKAAIARVMDHLEKRGLIFREADETDRRIKKVFLTPDGVALDRRIQVIRRKALEVSTRGISAEELEICRGTLKKIKKNLSDENI